MSIPSIYPYFGYRDAKAAIAFLEKAFGFVKTAEVQGENGTIQHAKMNYGNGAIMLGAYTKEQLAANPTQPIGHGVYISVTNVQEHYEKAKAAGAEIIWAPQKTEWGTERYRCKDVEGYEWSFGTYQPKIKNS